MNTFNTKDTIITVGQFSKEINYWLEKLSPDLEKSYFPYDYHRPGQDYITQKVSFKIEGPLFLNLSKICGQSDIKLFGLLAAGLNGLLYKYSGNDDILLAAPIYTQEEDEDFINTIIPLRIKIEEDDSFKTLLYQVKDVINEAGLHQNCPMEEVIDLVSDEDYLSLLETAILVSNVHQRKYIQRLRPSVLFSFTNTSHCIDVEVEYNVLSYRKDTIERIAMHFTVFLDECLIRKDDPLKDIEFIDQEEKRQLLYSLNDTGSIYPGDKTLHELFRDQAVRTPDCVSLVGSVKQTGETMHLTYLELNKRSDQVAIYLRQKNVQPDTIVGIIMERCVEMIIGLLGILKAGGAYLPIDSDYPQDRIDYMLKDSEAKLLVTTENMEDEKVGRWEGEKSFDILFLDTSILPDFLTSQPPNFPLFPAAGHWPPATSLAYIIYTSGSTGRPKGVSIEHISAVNLLLFQKNFFSITADERVLLFSTISFDASVEQIFIALFSGAASVLIDKYTLIDGRQFEEFICRQRITHIHAVPSFLTGIELENPYHVKRVISGGDVCPAALAKKWSTNFDFYNEYGPTETTVTSIEMKLSPADIDETLPGLPIGKPVSNTVVYLLDRGLKLVPTGVVGELYIGGLGVARGYLNNPELTAEKFDRDLWNYQDYHNENQRFLRERPGGAVFSKSAPPGRRRLYKTGDLVRKLPDGNLQVVGRIDQQVKIRGYRIELGEIRERLLVFDGIKEAVVISHADRSGQKQLCAYVVLEPGEELHVSEVREYLERHLPHYMIPSYFTRLESLPLTPNGKIHHKALPEPEIHEKKDYTAPGDAVEENLLQIWSEILEIEKEKIDVHDNFFHLGGHSLKSTILIARINKVFNVIVPLAEVFNTPFIRGLAQFIKKDAAKDKYISLELTEDKEYYALASAQKRLYILQQMASESTHYNIPFIYLLEKNIDIHKLQSAFKKLVARHESLRTSFEMVNEEPVQKIHEAQSVDFSIDYYKADETGAREIVGNYSRPFDLRRVPLLRVGVMKIGEEKHVLMFDMHHIITDGTSGDILAGDFIGFYSGKELPPLKYQYIDYAHWQNLEKVKQIFRHQEAYWLKQFEGEIPVMDIPADYMRPEYPEFKGSRIEFDISKEKTGQLKKIAEEENLTMFMVMFAFFNVLLSKLSLQEDIVVGTDVAGRRHVDLEQIVGCFVNSLPIRSFPRSEKRFKDFLAEVRNATISAFENQDYPFEDLVDKKVGKRVPNRNPLFDVMFSYHTNEAKQGNGSTVPLDYDYKKETAKFDLLLSVNDTGIKMYCTFEYKTSLFKKERIKKYIKFFEEILVSLLDDKTTKLKDIWLTSDLLDAETDNISIDFGF